MTTSPECERLRTQQMALLDGESGALSELDRAHLSTCSPCQRWLADLESMTAQLQGLSYPNAGIDLWAAVEGRVGKKAPTPSLPPRVWLVGGLVLGLRALQLLVDLPMPVQHLFVPLIAAAVIAAIWKIAGGALSIETWAPELQKGDV